MIRAWNAEKPKLVATTKNRRTDVAPFAWNCMLYLARAELTHSD